jgi:hypothetical protein
VLKEARLRGFRRGLAYNRPKLCFRCSVPGWGAKEDIGDLIQRMEELAIIQVQFGRMAKA